ncbi:hypothetical protein CDV36_014367 [Fusarium kuroshium]|uniref:BZIP domain-containing protein n=1 Tax=Fusarium kuroshium TaxID=2010991 RepID=A0A3M2RIE1_9HYPO|nr:hypothetical protein CDV36_014367 [Fusarium kuroshium]
MDSRPAIGVAKGSPAPTSTVETSHPQPSMASPEAHIRPPPSTTAWPQKTQWIQDSPTHPQGMQPYLGSSPSENAALPCPKGVPVNGMRASYFGVQEEQRYLMLPGSEQVISVPVDLAQASKKMGEKRKRNATASTRHRKKKKEAEERNLRELKELHEEKQIWEEKMKEIEEEKKELEEKLRYFQDIIRRVPSPFHVAREPNLAPQASTIAVGMDGLAIKPQSYEG